LLWVIAATKVAAASAACSTTAAGTAGL
jgi:hypothetical protein